MVTGFDFVEQNVIRYLYQGHQRGQSEFLNSELDGFESDDLGHFRPRLYIKEWLIDAGLAELGTFEWTKDGCNDGTMFDGIRILPKLIEVGAELDAEDQRIHEAQLARPAPTSSELRKLADQLRALAKAIFQGQDNRFVTQDAKRIPNPLVTGWYTRAVAWKDNEQQRLFHTVCTLLGSIAWGTADSPRERLESLATDIDELAAMLERQPATVETADDSAFVTAKTPDGEQQPLNAPKVYLSSWRELLDALGKDNNTTERRHVRAAHKKFPGPIIMPTHGGQPTVVKTDLLVWWNGLEDRYREEATVRDSLLADRSATLENQFDLGRGEHTETVVPDIAGRVKRRRGST